VVASSDGLDSEVVSSKAELNGSAFPIDRE